MVNVLKVVENLQLATVGERPELTTKLKGTVNHLVFRGTHHLKKTTPFDPRSSEKSNRLVKPTCKDIF